MKNGLPDKARVSVSKYRKTAMMSAAATALIAAAPAFADAQTADASLQATIRDILRTPAKEMSWQARSDTTPTIPKFSAISIGNSDDITVGDDQVAISHGETVEDVNVVNTGNLTGGVGIEVSTGAVDFSSVAVDFLDSDTFEFRERNIYDDLGNYLGREYTADGTYNARTTFLNPDSAASTISIDNSGSINFSGREGIKAVNPAGQSITIANSGDITHTSDLMHRSGIYAVTESNGYSDFQSTLTQPGEFTYNTYGQLTGVIARDQITYDRHDSFMLFDGGAINIHNTGDIDMGPVDYYMGLGNRASAGIFTRGDGGTTIVNDGSIKVGQYSAGIFTYTSGAASITNAGRIELAGNNSAGIFLESLNNATALYDTGGDVYILNTGDIVGGVTIADTPPYQYTDVRGIATFGQGTNSVTLGGVAELNQLINSYNEMLGEEVFTPYDIPYVRLYTTTVVNQGRIELADGARGIYMQQSVGDSIAINEGTITLGNGAPNWNSNVAHRSAGIYNSNLPVDGAGLVVGINTETGIIQTGDDGVGVAAFSYDGDSVAINEGVITTGDGVVKRLTRLQFPDYTYLTYDKLFHSQGLSARSADYHVGTTAYARNSGSVTVGELAVGSLVIGLGYSILDPARVTALNVNEGIIESGDNSVGMFTRGTNATTVNTGTVNSGSYDISEFLKSEDNGYRFEMTRNGVASSGANYSDVINYGTINVGDGKVGASAEMSYGWGIGARIVQDGDGVITTGDQSIGARVFGNQISMLDNAGRISVGDASIGAEITGGSVVLYSYETTPTVTDGRLDVSNTGVIETGDDSVGVRMIGIRDDVPWYGRVWEEPTPEQPWPHTVPISGTEDVTATSYFANSGTIRVGANSTAVEITGPVADDKGLQLLNAGLIEATQHSSTAVRVNADNALGSYVVNLGTIVGNMTFGAGDDHLMNTVMTNATGQVTGSGNIVMNGSTIDFGAGNNVFDNTSGMITLAGGDNLITGAEVVMTQGSIEARNNRIDSSLTIDGSVSGDFAFGADFDASGSDQIIITGDVADGSSMSVVLHPTRQLSGETTFTVISVGGENNADAPVIAGVTGNFADSLLGADISYSEATGEVTVTARFGMGHMGTSASAATTMAQDWWMQSVGTFEKRNLQHLAGLEDAGVSAWATMFQEEGTVAPSNELQDVSFDQKLSGLQTGIEWQGKVGGGTFNIGPMFSYGNAAANQNANLSSAMGDATAFGLNAGYRFSNGLYLNATWQQMAMGINFRTPGTASNALGRTEAEGGGFNVELGYAHKLKSGLTFAPQLQYASVTMDLDDFTTSDGVYALSELGGKHALLRAGVSMFKTFETVNGSITPLVDLSYLNAMDADSELASNGILFDNDSSGSGYRAEIGVAGRYKSWDISGRVGFAETAAIKSALSSNLTVRYRW